MTIVLDASTVIVLDQLNLLSNLMNLAINTLIPIDVLNEVKSERVQRLVKTEGHALVRPNIDLIPYEFRVALGRGELSVLAYCTEHREAWAVIDDLAAREVARRMDLKYLGTARLLRFMDGRDALHSRSLIDILSQLKESGFHIDDETKRRILKEAPPDLN